MFQRRSRWVANITKPNLWVEMIGNRQMIFSNDSPEKKISKNVSESDTIHAVPKTIETERRKLDTPQLSCG